MIKQIETLVNSVFKVDEELTIGFQTPDDGMMFLTESGDKIIYMDEVTGGIFNAEILAHYAKIAEEIYKGNNNTFVQVCLLCKDIKVTIPEMSVPSQAEFSIKLACMR